VPMAKAAPVTFSERLFALVACVARKWIVMRFSTSIPLPEIDNHVIAKGGSASVACNRRQGSVKR
jgi:hypothetical protein